MSRPLYRRRSAFAAAVLLLAARVAVADIYDPPATYYATATGTGSALRANLYAITKAGFVTQNYGDSRDYLGTLWQDPADSTKQLALYSTTNVNKAWDQAATWNREHTVPQSVLGASGISNTYNGYASDLFEVAPARTTDNSARGNYGYGYTGTAASASGKITGTDGNTYFYPGDRWRGDVARTAFYMATRYGTAGHGGGTKIVTLANGIPNANGQMGDLNSLLHWAYEDPVDTFERRKNALVYSGLTVSGTNYSQGNRNPYIDHPEYIWAAFGTSANDSRLSVATAAADGTSTATVDLGRVLVGSALATDSVTLAKTGTAPTTYNVAAAGDATTTAAGTGQTFAYNAGSRSFAVGLSSSTATAGLKSGTVTIDNTDLTTAAAGQGSADGDDTVAVRAAVLDHSSASLSAAGVVSALTLDFGTVAQGTGTQLLPVGVTNLSAKANYTAGLNLTALTAAGSTAALTTSLAPFTALPAGTTAAANATLSTANLGTYATTVTLATADEALPGATAGRTLTLTLTGRVLVRQWYADADGTWSAAARWLGPVPTNAGDTANFGSVITAPRTVTLDSARSAGHVTFDSASAYTITGPATLTLANGSAAADLTVLRGSHTIAAPLAVASPTTLTTAAAAALTIANDLSGPGPLTLAGPGVVTLTAGVTTRVAPALTLSDNARLTLAAGTRQLLVVPSLSIAPSASLDLTGNDLLVRDGDLAALTARAAAAFAGGTWAGPGLTSATAAADAAHLSAVGVIPNTADGTTALYATVDGTPAAADDVLARLTIYGDANLDGRVDIADYTRLDAGFLTGGHTWLDGDFDYDGTVDASDYTLADNAFNHQSAPAARATAQVAAVPEPAAALAVAAGLATFRRRRCRHRCR